MRFSLPSHKNTNTTLVNKSTESAKTRLRQTNTQYTNINIYTHTYTRIIKQNPEVERTYIYEYTYTYIYIGRGRWEAYCTEVLKVWERTVRREWSKPKALLFESQRRSLWDPSLCCIYTPPNHHLFTHIGKFLHACLVHGNCWAVVSILQDPVVFYHFL